MKRNSFGLSENQVNEALNFMALHNNKCPGITAQKRAEVEFEEECTPTSSYEYIFVPSGIADYTYIGCCICHERKQIHLSIQEIELL